MNSSNTLFVTIGIPTYNRAGGYLKEALACAVNQTYDNLEIVISDNCSTDNTPELVASFKDSRIRYFRQKENIKANDNFNFCLDQARGDYFLLLHDDDRIDHDFVETCVQHARGSKDFGIIRTGTRLINEHGDVVYEKENKVGGFSTEDFFLGWFQNQTALYLCSTLFNTEQLKKIGGFRSKNNLFQDVIAEVILAAKFGRVDCRAVKASFRRHSDNRGDYTNVMGWCEDSLQLMHVMCDLLPQNREELQAQGLPYLCRKNYRKASNIPNVTKRLTTYFNIYRLFGYTCSPYETIRTKDLRLLKQYIKLKF